MGPFGQANVGPISQTNVGPFGQANVGPISQANVGPFGQANVGPINQANVGPLCKMGWAHRKNYTWCQRTSSRRSNVGPTYACCLRSFLAFTPYNVQQFWRCWFFIHHNGKIFSTFNLSTPVFRGDDRSRMCPLQHL